jgi:uncharacterized protein
MATSLLALLDDIATILDDVSVMTKVAAKKTAGVLGDDLALNAQQVAGVRAERELPVVWAVAKGSFWNKVILVPAALAISYFAPWAITPLLMVGGAFLCYEGVEKLAHKFLHSKQEDDAAHKELVQAVADEQVDMVAHENEKIKGAVRTDFILSAEIIVIALGSAAASGAPFGTQAAVVVAIALLMTVGVYGLVAGIVKLDDFGLYLSKGRTALAQSIGRGIVAFAPWLMKALSVLGTAAMFLVGGGILVHGWPALAHAIEGFGEKLASSGGMGVVWGALATNGANLVLGVIAGAIVLAVVTPVMKMLQKAKA